MPMERNSIGKGTLYVVATPIGNLEDMTFRAVRILTEVGIIACEDTRRTRKLLAAYQIHTPVTSLHGYNEEKKSAVVVGRLTEGTDVAYVTDAGTPGISDPGYALIKQALRESIRIVPIPGPSAAITALSISGLPMDSFLFKGFLPHRAAARKRLLSFLSEEPITLVFYESPKRLLATLRDTLEVLGDRRCAIAREITKIHEEFLRGTISHIIGILDGKPIKGEVTVVVEGRRDSLPALTEDLESRIFVTEDDPQLSRRDIIERIAKETGLPKRVVYQRMIRGSER